MAKILLIEDDQILLKMYTSKFEGSGFEVIGVKEGEEGIKKAESEKPDFILLDWVIPKMNGGEILKSLKEKSATKDIPVAILSVMAPDTLTDVNEEVMSQIVGYWQKDRNNPSEVLKKVKKYLAESKEESRF